MPQLLMIENSMPKQFDFHYFECPECEFSSIQKSDFSGNEACPLCAGDSGHHVLMHRRIAMNSDVAEGYDARNVLS